MARRSIYRNVGGEASDLAYAPCGGKAKMILLGIILPIGIVGYAIQGWISEEVIWIADRNANDLVVTGRTAKPVSLCWFFAGLFTHVRWFWGLMQWHRAYEIGTLLTVIGFLVSGGFAFYEIFRFGA